MGEKGVGRDSAITTGRRYQEVQSILQREKECQSMKECDEDNIVKRLQLKILQFAIE